MKKIDRKAVHAFFDTIISGESDAEKVLILKDLLVDEFCFGELLDVESFSDFTQKIAERMKNDSRQKVMCIRDVRVRTGCGLLEAKKFVESLQPGHPTYGTVVNLPFPIGEKEDPGLPQVMMDKFLERLVAKLNKLAVDYKVPSPFGQTNETS